MSRRLFQISIFLQNRPYSPFTSLRRPFSYKSAISLENLYPNSSLKISTPTFTPLDPNSKFSGFIPIEKLDISYSCSSGPGGQNVNKVKTKVDLRFKVCDADWLDSSIREKILLEQKNKLTKDGYYIIKSELTRSQQLNLADCMRKLRDLIRAAAKPEPQISPDTEEKLRRRRERAARERLFMKRADAERRNLKIAPSVHEL